jgi:exopolysaccharide biosynthesis protein
VIAMASNTGTSLKSLVERGKGVAGINGAYFTPRDYTGKPDTTNTVRIMLGDGKSYSKYFPDTGVNGIFWFTREGNPLLVQNNIYGEKTLRANYNSDRIEDIESGIANFPILLASGVNLVPTYDQAWLITEKMKVKWTKSFICRTKQNDIKMGTLGSISMMDVPSLIKKFGCIDAINLDNGGSLALYDNKKYVVVPGRNIMDAFVIVKK